MEYFDFAPGLADHIAAASLVISHAGAGSLFEALGARKAVIAVPNSLLMHNHQVWEALAPICGPRPTACAVEGLCSGSRCRPVPALPRSTASSMFSQHPPMLMFQTH